MKQNKQNHNKVFESEREYARICKTFARDSIFFHCGYCFAEYQDLFIEHPMKPSHASNIIKNVIKWKLPEMAQIDALFNTQKSRSPSNLAQDKLLDKNWNLFEWYQGNLKETRSAFSASTLLQTSKIFKRRRFGTKKFGKKSHAATQIERIFLWDYFNIF